MFTKLQARGAPWNEDSFIMQSGRFSNRDEWIWLFQFLAMKELIKL